MKAQIEAQRHAALYIDRVGKTAIVVTLHYNGMGGFLYEDTAPSMIERSQDSKSVGTAVLTAFEKSEIRPPTTHRDQKLTDWPAFQSSGCRSVRQFEADFIRIHIYGANEANLIYAIEGSPEKDAELRVLTSAPSASPAKLGERCLAVWRACRDRSL
jgi:hypothetical protein